MRAPARAASLGRVIRPRPLRTALLLALLCSVPAGCARLAPSGAAGGAVAAGPVVVPTDPEEVAAVVAEAGRARALPGDRRTAEDFDTTTERERVVAVAAAAQKAEEQPLGATIASLGDATSPGLWLETPLVARERPGRLSHAAAGTSVLVELRPSGGAAGSGSRASLAALRLLEAPLAGLTEIEVFGR